MSNTAYPKISVIIPVRNEALRMRQCIEGILKQTIPVHEIIVIDSGSTDGTLEILNSFPEVTLIEIDGADFNHGLTRNLGVEACSGEFCLLTVGDAYAYDAHWIAHMMDGFTDDEVLAVCGQQVVDHLPENNPLQWFRPFSEPNIKRLQFSASQWAALTPTEKRDATGWDDVNAMYRREALIHQPFEKTSYSEDAIWAFNALANGHAIAYNKRGRVYHYHNEDADFAFKRALTSHYFRFKLTRAIPERRSKSIRNELSPIFQLFVKWDGSWKEKMFWWKYNQSRSRAFQQALEAFHAHFQQGEQALDDYHEEICGKPPIPKKGK
jgi:rhamnosyltransferase